MRGGIAGLEARHRADKVGQLGVELQTIVAELEFGQLLVGAAAACEKPVDHHLGSGSHDVDAQIGSQRRKSNQSWLFLRGRSSPSVDMWKRRRLRHESRATSAPTPTAAVRAIETDTSVYTGLL